MFNFRTTYVNTKGEVVYNYRCIALNYLTGKTYVGLIVEKVLKDTHTHGPLDLGPLTLYRQLEKNRQDQRHTIRDRRPSMAACPICWAMGTKELK